MKKARIAKEDAWLAILEYRNTPAQPDYKSPTERLFGRMTRTGVPTQEARLRPTSNDLERPTTLTPERKCSQQQSAYNKRAKDLRQLNIGDTVRVKPKRSEWPWRKAQITGCCGPRSYTLRTEEGRSLRRNRRHLRKSLESFEPALRSPESNAQLCAL